MKINNFNKKTLIVSVALITISLSIVWANKARGMQRTLDIPQQGRVCHIQDSHRAGVECKEGDIMLFVPRVQAGIGRTVVILSSLVCDFRFNITRDVDALTCVFTEKRRDQWHEFGMD